jgi:hypothetical protein
MAADVDNLRRAWRCWVAERDLDQLNKLVDSLWLLYDARGWYHATIELTTDLLNVLSSSPSTPERATQEVQILEALLKTVDAAVDDIGQTAQTALGPQGAVSRTVDQVGQTVQQALGPKRPA